MIGEVPIVVWLMKLAGVASDTVVPVSRAFAPRISGPASVRAIRSPEALRVLLSVSPGLKPVPAARRLMFPLVTVMLFSESDCPPRTSPLVKVQAPPVVIGPVVIRPGAKAALAPTAPSSARALNAPKVSGIEPLSTRTRTSD